MKEIMLFLNHYYDAALKLSYDFGKTRDHDWSPMVILNELDIQIGHVYNIIYSSDAVNEPNRQFTNMGDEFSDVLLQLIALSASMNFNFFDIQTIASLEETSWYAYPVLFGQLNEAIMEKYGLRFSKPRAGFATLDDFIKNRIFRLFDVTFQIASKLELDLDKEFELMLIDANNFLKKFDYGRRKIKKD